MIKPTYKTSLSVIISIYDKDQPSFVQKSLLSISSQTLVPDKVVIANDGPISTSLHDTITSWIKTVKFEVIRIDIKNNKGLAFALNRCLEASDSQYIARLDADDINESNRFEEQVRFLDSNPIVDVVGSYISQINEKSLGINGIVTYPITHGECLKEFRFRDPLAHPSTMFRRRFFIKAGLYDELYVGKKNYEDTMLWFSGFKRGCVFANIPLPLLKFRISKETLGRRGGYKKNLFFLKSRLKICKELNFPFTSKIYAILYFVLQICPLFIKNFFYKVFR
jgi:glycosyltransferase involved in cell wall biosynthesis